MKPGISILQGPHHVAQKSSRITLPLKSASLTSLPVVSLSVKSRLAGLASAGHAAASSTFGVFAALPPQAVASATSTRTAEHRIRIETAPPVRSYRSGECARDVYDSRSATVGATRVARRAGT